MLDKYQSFQCLAGNCPSTCCSGWRIFVDEKDFMRFEKLEPEWLREDILSHIQNSETGCFFENRLDGSCSMLDEDGLCRIQRNTSEGTLCNTCRKYPRLLNTIGEVVYMSMAASCPVISEYLIKDCVRLQVMDASGRGKKATVGELAFAGNALHLYQGLWQSAEELRREKTDWLLMYRCFEKMAAEVLDIVIRYSEKSITADFFEVMESDVSEQMEGFADAQKACWHKISGNYMEYRIFSRKIEFPKSEDVRCVRQGQGELLLLRVLAFCRYCEKEGLSDSDWQELLQRVYRFCAHGKKVSRAFENLIDRFFSWDVLWSYMLI